MKFLPILSWLLVAFTGQTQVLLATQHDAASQDRIILVVGAGGTDEYTQEFNQWAESWEQLAEQQSWQLERIQQDAEDRSPKSQLQKALSADSKDTDSKDTDSKDTDSKDTDSKDTDSKDTDSKDTDSKDTDSKDTRLWIVMLGHGTFDRGIAKFNLNGPDVSAKELNTWLAGHPKQVIVVSCFSSSAPFLSELAGPKRIVVSATKSGSEYNYSRFGKYLAAAIQNFDNDIDHDKEVSLLEAFLAASKGTQRFYEQEARLASEHALLDDNGDKVGTSADFYRGLRPVKEAKQGSVDGNTASRMILLSAPDSIAFNSEQLQRRAELEGELDQLRNLKSQLDEEEYFEKLESILLSLAAIYNQAEQQDASQSP